MGHSRAKESDESNRPTYLGSKRGVSMARDRSSRTMPIKLHSFNKGDYKGILRI